MRFFFFLSTVAFIIAPATLPAQTTAVIPKEFYLVLEEISNIQDKMAVSAIVRAYYPDPLTALQHHNDDVRFLINGIWIYYADGKLLAEEKLPEIHKYRTNMYHYRLEKLEDIFDSIPPPIEQLYQIPRSVDFQHAVTQGMPENAMHKRFHFFGKAVDLHPIAGRALQKVELQLIPLLKTNTQLALFINSIQSLSGYANRNIEKSINVSMHAFGLALDIIPKSYNGKDVYWLWRKSYSSGSQQKSSLEERWIIPSEIVAAFENNGFIWGGKWRNYDSIHLEYRPELLLYAQYRTLTK